MPGPGQHRRLFRGQAGGVVVQLFDRVDHGLSAATVEDGGGDGLERVALVERGLQELGLPTVGVPQVHALMLGLW
jgi:hypothetical protein